ncbi:hypothetical protein D3C71_1884540 [compost metagenome]
MPDEMRADRLDAGVGVLLEVDPVAHGASRDGEIATLTQAPAAVWNECAAVNRIAGSTWPALRDAVLRNAAAATGATAKPPGSAACGVDTPE